MKALLAMAGLGLALSCPALAQTTTVPVTGNVSNATAIPRIPASAVPGQPGASANEVSAAPLTPAVPTNQPSTLYPNGVPTRDIDAGNSRAAQPRSGQATPGAQPTKSIFKGRKRQ